jgi:hypothetical protein
MSAVPETPTATSAPAHSPVAAPVGNLVFATEPLRQWWEAAAPMQVAHWREVGRYQEKIPLRVDVAKFFQIEQLGCLTSFTARNAQGALVGYQAYFVTPSLHERDHTFAINDLLYLAPEHRRGHNAARFFGYCITELKLRGVSLVSVRVPVEHDFGALMRAIGFDLVEHVHQKVLI